MQTIRALVALEVRSVIDSTIGMTDSEFDPRGQFLRAWQSVSIARTVPYSLFTFGESELPYFLVVDGEKPGDLVTVNRGVVKVTRPMIVTPHNAQPEFKNFFEDEEYGGLIDFLLARSAAFSHLRVDNQQQTRRLVSDTSEEAVANLQQQLDDEEEDRIAILTAPAGLGGIAVLKYTAERIMESAPGNIQELRERGFLPED